MCPLIATGCGGAFLFTHTTQKAGMSEAGGRAPFVERKSVMKSAKSASPRWARTLSRAARRCRCVGFSPQ